MSSDSEPDREVDPSWWEAAFAVDDLAEGEWQAPEIVSRHIERLASDAPEGTLQREVLVALMIASSAMLDPESWDEPFKPMMVMGGRRSALPTDLTEAQFDLLGRALPHIQQAPLRARVADVLWCFGDRSNSELLGIAVDAYLAVPLERDVWIRRGADAWRRGAELVRRRRSADKDRLAKISDALCQRILGGSVDDGFLLVHLSDLLSSSSRVDGGVCVQLATHLAGLAATSADNGNLRLSRHLERKAEQWFRSVNDARAANESVERVARLYEQEANQRVADGADGSAMAAGIFLEKAIRTFRALPRKYRTERGLDSHLADLRTRLADNREATLEAMHRIEIDPIDLTDAVADTRKRLSGLSRFEALAYLAASWPLSDPEKDRAHAEELAEGSLRHLFGGSTYAADGRKVAASEGGLGQTDAAIRSDMARNASMKRGVVATAFILPGLEVIAFEHRFDLAFLHRLCLDSPWVPPGHEDLWARGLRHGLNSDFPSAISVLVPQIEHALRQVLKSRGAYTLMVDDATGVESEKALPALLATPECAEALGTDLQYELVTLLIQQEGDNLRHDTAHGLLHDSQAWSAGAVYAWWLCLRLVVVPVWNIRKDSDGNSAAEVVAEGSRDSDGGLPPGDGSGE